MGRDRRALLEMLASIADGAEPALDRIEPDEARTRDRLRDIRVIAGVAQLHRTLTFDDDAGPFGGARVVGRIGPREAAAGAIAPTTWGSFVLREKLGDGVSADVYRAYDPPLDRDVAIKLYRPLFAQRPDAAARMLREARALARVRHEHIVHVYGADEHDGRLGVWMELVRGRTLEAELQERGKWSAREAAAAGQDLCRALAAVHHAGLIHNDVKAQNVIREEGGRILLMDFGSGHARTADPATIQRAGTPLYVAPEVLAGGASSPASDVYSLGVLLYHLVSGSYPVEAASMEELRASHARGRATALQDIRPDLPPDFVRVVERALASNAAERFQTAAQMETALAHVLGSSVPVRQPAQTEARRWPFLVAAAAVAVIALLMMFRSTRPVPLAGKDSVAVLPFRPIGGQEEAAHLSEGVSTDLTSLLSKLSDLTVVSGVSVQRYKGSDRPPSEIGRGLGVQTLVAGSVQVAGDRIRIHVALVDCESATSLWSEQFDRQTRDLFAIQTEVARRIATALKGRLSSREATLLQQRPGMDYGTFELYSLGRYHWNKRTPEGLRRSIEYFTQAAEREPTSGLPYAGLADAYVLSEVYGLLSPLDAQALAEKAAIQAVQNDPTLAEAHAALGSIRQEQLRWAEAEQALTEALALGPGYAPAHHWYALYLTSHARFDEAIEQMDQALTLDPLSVAMRAAMGFVHYMKGDSAAAVSHYRRALELETGLDWLHRNLAIAQLSAGDYDEALLELAKAPPDSETVADLNAIRASVYALAGQSGRAREMLLTLDREPAAAPFSALERAMAWFSLGEDATAFAWLDRAFVNGEHDLQYLAVEPRLSHIRGDDRFRQLLQRAGLQGPPEGRGR